MADEGQRAVEAKTENKTAASSVGEMLWEFGKKLSGYAALYFLGYYQLSTAWILIIVIVKVIRQQWKKEKDFQNRMTRASNLDERDVVLARVKDLPAWVFFPDVERVEWINKILRQVWPNVNHYARNMIIESIEPNLKENLKPYKMGNFRFEKIVLGSLPPRIGGIKVYSKNVSREEIVLDLDLFYAGDCDLRVRMGGLPAGIKDLQIHGKVRVVLKPLLQVIPFFGGMQFFFLNSPKIDFNLVGVADVLDMPGLSDLLRRVVTEQIDSMMVLPNKYTVQLSSDVLPALLKVPEPEGVLRVRVIEARQLMKMDVGVLGLGKSDPYAIISIGAQQFRTKVISNTVKPHWDFICEFAVEEPKGEVLGLRVMDDDMGNSDDFLGRATVEIHTVVKKGYQLVWIPLEDVKSGAVHLELTWLTFSTNPLDLSMALVDIPGRAIHSAALIVYIDSAKNLPSIRQTAKPDPYCVVKLGGCVIGQQQQTQSVQRTGDPVWEAGFVFLVKNPESDDLYVRVMDGKTGSELGHLKIILSSLLEKQDLLLEGEPQPLKGSGPDSKLFLSVYLKILKKAEAQNVSDEEDEEGENGSNRDLREIGSEVDALSTTSTKGHKDGEPGSLRGSLTSGEDTVGGEEILRKRSTATGSGQYGLGRVQLTIRYSSQRQQLIVVLHKAVNLAEGEDGDLPDPYAKLYLLPDRSKDSKRKTVVIKDNRNPLYDETFEFTLPPSELKLRKLEVTVVSKKGFFAKSPILGLIIIDLGAYELSKAVTEWFDLQPYEPGL